MSNKILDNQDLDKVSGGAIDETKRYSFYEYQSFKSKTDDLVSIIIDGNYIDVPYDTKISLYYINQANNQKIKDSFYAYYIDENFY